MYSILCSHAIIYTCSLWNFYRQEDRTYEPVAVSVDSSVRYSGLVQDQQPNDRIQVAKNESYSATHGLPQEQ